MRISIIAVGTRMPTWVQQGVDEYDRRLPRELGVRWLEIPLARRGKDVAGEATVLRSFPKSMVTTGTSRTLCQ